MPERNLRARLYWSGCCQPQSDTDLSLYTQLTETNQASSTHRVPFLSPSRLARSKAGRSPGPPTTPLFRLPELSECPSGPPSSAARCQTDATSPLSGSSADSCHSRP
ncbi:hypothetical protein AOLI_G00267160 [Acnodon oligacanthus]